MVKIRLDNTKDRSVIVGNDIVIKKHQSKSNLNQEVEDIKGLQFFDQYNLGSGWTIRIPKVLDVDLEQGKFVMERLRGNTLEEFIKMGRLRKIPWEKLGQILAIYHWQNRTKNNQIYTLGDFNRSNIIISTAERTIGIIDPGVRHGQIATQWRDIHLFERSLWYGQVKHRRSFRKEVIRFREGYTSVQNQGLYRKGFYNELFGQWYAIRDGAIIRSGIKKLFYYLWGIFWVVTMCFDGKFKFDQKNSG